MVEKVDTTIKGLSIGYDLKTDMPREEESLMITSDYNFVNVDFFLEYKVSDPIKALYASEDPVMILKNMAQGCIRSVIGSYDVDSVITTGKSEIQSKIKTMLMDQLDSQDVGIQLVNITIQDAEPPTEAVKEAFQAAGITGISFMPVKNRSGEKNFEGVFQLRIQNTLEEGLVDSPRNLRSIAICEKCGRRKSQDNKPGNSRNSKINRKRCKYQYS